MRVLISSGGFISSHLIKALELDESVDKVDVWTRKGGKKNSNKVKYTTDPDFYESYDTIFHTFGCSTTSSPTKEIWESNVDFTLNLLELISQKIPPNFIYFSSNMAAVSAGHTVYGASKRAGEQLVLAYDQMRRINAHILRPCAVVGANNTHGLLKDLVKKLQADGETIELLGSRPGSDKPFVYVGDLVNWCTHQMNNYDPANVYNMGPTDTLTVLEVTEIVQEIMGTNKKIKWSGQTWIGDVNKIVPESNVLTRSSADAIRCATMDILETK